MCLSSQQYKWSCACSTQNANVPVLSYSFFHLSCQYLLAFSQLQCWKVYNSLQWIMAIGLHLSIPLVDNGKHVVSRHMSSFANDDMYSSWCGKYGHQRGGCPYLKSSWMAITAWMYILYLYPISLTRGENDIWSSTHEHLSISLPIPTAQFSSAIPLFVNLFQQPTSTSSQPLYTTTCKKSVF